MSRILVTGASGFTGRYLAPLLAGAGHEVHGTTHGEAGETPGVSQMHSLDLADAAGVDQLMRDIAPDKVVHLAAIAFVAHSDVAEMYRTNIGGTRNLLSTLVRAASPPEAVIVASSANVYGNSREGTLDEDTPVAPANDYAVTKVATEHVAALFRQRLPIIVTRPFNYTGKGQSEQFLVPKIVAHARAGADEIELGNVEVSRDFSDVRAVAEAYARLLDAPAAVGGTFNICSGRAISLAEIVEMARAITGAKLQVRVNPAFVRKDDVRSLCGSRARLDATIGPMDMPPFEETLRWMIAA